MYRFWGLPDERAVFGLLVETFEASGRVEVVWRRSFVVDAAIEYPPGRGRMGFRILVSGRLRARRRLLAIAHELAEEWLRGERYDSVETDCDAVALELVSPSWVPGVQLELALGA